MLRITHGEIDGEAIVTEHATNACEIIDGALIVLSDENPSARYLIAGYAPGSWAEFEIVKDGA